MKIINLEQGQILKNYKELCEVLEIKVNTGKSKILQLKELERFVSYSKQGNKFIINEIYATPKEKIDNRKDNGRNPNSRGQNSVYSKEINKNILDLLAKNQNDTVDYTKNQLFVALGLVNTNYVYCKYNKDKLFTYLNFKNHIILDLKMKNTIIEEFYYLNNKSFTEKTEAQLNNLQKKKILKWELKTIIATNKKHYVASELELQQIKDTEQIILITLGLEGKHLLNTEQKRNKFNRDVCILLRENNLDINFYYNKYFITNLIEKGILKYKLPTNSELNNIACNNLLKNAEKRQNKDYQQPRNVWEMNTLIIRKSEEYLADYKKLIETLISTDTEDLQEEIVKKDYKLGEIDIPT